MHTLRIFIGLAVGLLACALAAPPPLGLGSAHAQELAAVKKKKVKKHEPRRREPRKQEQERAPFTAEEQNAAVVLGTSGRTGLGR